MPPINILHTHLSESFLQSKKLSFISRQGGLKKQTVQGCTVIL